MRRRWPKPRAICCQPYLPTPFQKSWGPPEMFNYKSIIVVTYDIYQPNFQGLTDQLLVKTENWANISPRSRPGPQNSRMQSKKLIMNGIRLVAWGKGNRLPHQLFVCSPLRIVTRIARPQTELKYDTDYWQHWEAEYKGQNLGRIENRLEHRDYWDERTSEDLEETAGSTASRAFNISGNRPKHVIKK